MKYLDAQTVKFPEIENFLFVRLVVQKWTVIEMILTCQDCKHFKKCIESDRKYICTSFQKSEFTGKMLKVSKIRAKMYIEEEVNDSKGIS